MMNAAGGMVKGAMKKPMSPPADMVPSPVMKKSVKRMPGYGAKKSK